MMVMSAGWLVCLSLCQPVFISTIAHIVLQLAQTFLVPRGLFRMNFGGPDISSSIMRQKFLLETHETNETD